MGDSGILKAALFFLCVILVVVLFMPKNCAKQAASPLAALQRAKEPKPKGLQIESSTPPPASENIAYPAGLDAEHLQYMIEVDTRFAAPKSVLCPKQEPNDIYGAERIVHALRSLKYIEKQPDGTYAFTQDGLLHVTSADEGAAWRIEVAKRQFVRMKAIACATGDQCDVTFTWQWQPNDVGAAMRPQLVPHQSTATIVSGPTGWVLSDIRQLDADL
jgi:hypothetical protein